ncbi:MAG: sulfite exporter TauE/SafE family protein [bacterium]|nr:sulfite exporter TauE/SafE family protein [bacterium]
MLEIETIGFIIPAFFAGLLTFLAPCTLPLVPGYLGFISGVSLEDLKNPEKAKGVRLKIFLNGVLYVLGFSVVFMILGTIFAAAGLALAVYQLWLTRIGGIFILIFGLYMTGLLNLSFLNFLGLEKQFPISKYMKPGNPLSSFMFGATFAMGWTPCVGPVLGSILTLAATTGTVGQGTFLLGIFALGLAVPFLLIAGGIGSAARYLDRIMPYLKFVSVIGGVFLIFLGVLLVTDNFSLWLSKAYEWFGVVGYDKLLDYL